MSSGGRKYGLWHLTSPPRRSSLFPYFQTQPNRPKHPRTKSNGDVGTHLPNETIQSLVSESRNQQSKARIHRERSLTAVQSCQYPSGTEQSVRRSASDYATSSVLKNNALANSTPPIPRLHKSQDEERRPLLTATSIDVVSGYVTGYIEGGRRLPSSHTRNTRKDISSTGRANSLPERARFSVEHTEFIEEDDGHEANDTCQPLPHKKKQQGPIWTRFSQKRFQPDEITETVDSSPKVYRPLDRSASHRLQKSSVSSYSPTLTTPSSSHLHRSPDLGRSITRGATTNDLAADVSASQLVHASRCELYTNRAILLCILSGFVLFFVGSISFVAYVLAEKSYADGTVSVSNDDT